MFIQIDKQTLILKYGGKRSSSYESKASMSFILMSRISLWSLIMKRKEIIIWIHVYPNSQMNINTRKWWKDKLFLWNQALMSFILMSWVSLWCLNMIKKGLLCESVFVLVEKWTSILKNGCKRSFSYEPKASMSFIPKKRISLWFPIVKRKEIIMWIQDYPN